MMTRKKIARAVVLAAFLALPAAAGPLEDGEKALAQHDYKMAAQAYAIAAAQGDGTARARLGVLYAYGIGVPQDIKQALALLNESAQQGNPLGETALAQVYAEGRIVPQYWGQALIWYDKAAQQGFAPAQTQLGNMYFNGVKNIVKQDYATALSWYQQAANQGDVDAQFQIGFMSFSGKGAPVDYNVSARWFAIAAQLGAPQAQTFLGVSYATGRGVPQDYTQSAKYYRLAAQQGYVDAMGLLGEQYLKGQGVQQDNSRAYLLTNLASAHIESTYHEAAVRERDEAAAKLTPEEIAAAQKLAGYCQRSGYGACLDDSKSVAAEAAAPSSSAAIADATAKQTGAGSKLDSTGTGFFVSGDGYIATAAHVVDGCSEMRSPHLHLKIVAEDKASDVAILSSGEKSPYFIRLRGGRGPRVGEAVVAVGFPLHGLLGDDIIVTGGIVSSLAGMKNDRRDIQISAPTQPGNSGGPIVGEDGTLVGVLQGGLDAVKFAQVTGDVPQNVNFAVSAGTLQSFLNAHQVPYILSEGAAKKGSAEISAEASRYTIFLECWK